MVRRAGPPVRAEPTSGPATPNTGDRGAPPATSTAPAAAEPSVPEASAGKPFAFFADLWSRRRAAQQRGDAREATQILASLVDAKIVSGWSDIFVYGDALVREAEAALAAKDAASARMLALAAVALAPHRPSAHFCLSRAQWAAGVGLGATIGAYWRGLVVTWSEPPLLRAALGNLLVAVLLALLVAAVALALAALYRQGRLGFHDLHHLLPGGATRLQAWLLGAAILLAPVFFRLGVVWVVLVWLTLLSIYFSPRERAGAVLALGALTAFAFGLPFVISHWSYPGSRSQDVYLTLRDAGATAAAERLRARARPDPEELYALGLRARWSGDLPRAREWLERAAQILEDSDLLVTTGDVRYWTGDAQGAVAAYKQALSFDTDNVAALFNLSRVYYTMAEHQKAGAAQRRAMSLDLERVERLNDQARRANGTFLVDGGVPRRLLNLPLAYSRSHWRAVNELWNAVGAGPRLTFGLAAAGAAILVALMGLLQRILQPASLCPRCGRAACHRCNREMPNQAQCGECYHAFVDTTNVDPQECIKKEIQAHRYRARQTRLCQVLSILLAGGAQTLRGSYLHGALYTTGFVSLGLLTLWAGGVLPAVAAPAGVSYGSLAIAAALGLLTLYVLSLLDGVREEG